MPKSPHSQCFCKISHAESHEFHEESNGLNSFPSPSLMKSNDFKGFHLLMIMADPLLGGSAKKSAFSNSAYLVDLQGGGGFINPGLALLGVYLDRCTRGNCFLFTTTLPRPFFPL